MIITIDEKLIETLDLCASRDAISSETWVERKIEAILSDKKLNNLIDTVKKDVDNYEPIIKNKKIELENAILMEEEANKKEPIFN